VITTIRFAELCSDRNIEPRPLREPRASRSVSNLLRTKNRMVLETKPRSFVKPQPTLCSNAFVRAGGWHAQQTFVPAGTRPALRALGGGSPQTKGQNHTVCAAPCAPHSVTIASLAYRAERKPMMCVERRQNSLVPAGTRLPRAGRPICSRRDRCEWAAWKTSRTGKASKMFLNCSYFSHD